MTHNTPLRDTLTRLADEQLMSADELLTESGIDITRPIAIDELSMDQIFNAADALDVAPSTIIDALARTMHQYEDAA